MVYQNETLGVSREPLFTAARILMGRGVNHQEKIELWLDGQIVARSIIRDATRLTLDGDGRVVTLDRRRSCT